MRKITKMVVGLLVVIGLTSSAQASWIPFVDGCVNTHKFTLKKELDHGIVIYTTSELNHENKGYQKIPGSPYYTYVNISNQRFTFDAVRPAVVCKIEGDRYIGDAAYDSYTHNPSYFSNKHSSAFSKIKAKIEDANTAKVKAETEAKALVEAKENYKMELLADNNRLLAENNKLIKENRGLLEKVVEFFEKLFTK